MKMQMTRLNVFLRSAMILSVLGFCSVSQAAIVVNLKVSASEDELQVETHGTCISGSNENGCVHVTGKQEINFNLTGSKVCAELPGAKWVLESVVLSQSKNAAPGISPEAAADFGADQATGLVTATVSQNPNHIGIRDDNRTAYDIWYTVNAKCAGGRGAISTDPRIENDGTGSN